MLFLISEVFRFLSSVPANNVEGFELSELYIDIFWPFYEEAILGQPKLGCCSDGKYQSNRIDCSMGKVSRFD